MFKDERVRSFLLHLIYVRLTFFCFSRYKGEGLIENNTSLMPGKKIFVCKMNLRNFTYLFSRKLLNKYVRILLNNFSLL